MKLFLKLFSIFLFILLSGCAGTISPTEYEDFKPLPNKKRITNQTSVHWIVMDDVSDVCKIPDKTNSYQFVNPIACARWRSNECYIYTNSTTTHVALGHELRHCFEGNFH